MGLVIDTSALVGIERAAVPWHEALAPVLDQPAVVPAIVYAELLVGALLADSPKRAAHRHAKIAALAAALPIVEFTEHTARRWAELFAALSRGGQLIPGNDLAVAATAQELGYGVLVGAPDEKHFRSIPGLEITVLQA